MKKYLLFIMAIATSAVARAGIIDFHIGNGNGDRPWNSSANPIRGVVGDVIRIHNDDVTRHRLHTYGAPCPHGPVIAPGEAWDCMATLPYSSAASGPLYDHIYGPPAEVWLEIGSGGRAASSLPNCEHMGEPQNTFNNREILRLKNEGADHVQKVALVHGLFTKLYRREGERVDFQMRIGPRASDTVEVSNLTIGGLPRLRAGDRVIACGIFQTGKEDALLGRPSPDGGFIFDTNFAWKPTADDGFLVINGVLYNQ